MSATERATAPPITLVPRFAGGLKLPPPEPPRFSLSSKIAFARTDRPLPYSRDMRGVPTVSSALQGEAAEGIWLLDQELYHVVAAPVLEGGSRTVGAIAAGFQINDLVASSLKSLVNAEVVFLADAARLNEPAKPVVTG